MARFLWGHKNFSEGQGASLLEQLLSVTSSWNEETWCLESRKELVRDEHF